MVTSPLTNKPAKKIAVFDASKIIAEYKDLYGIDVSVNFVNNKDINLYKCQQTGYEFFYPFEIAGNNELYAQLAVNDWYYIPWKWEHQQALSYVKQSTSILEIGCGTGYFLKQVKNRFPEKLVFGLELSAESSLCDNIIKQTIQEHIKVLSTHYDMVCSFQVLEHISDVNSFIEASVKALKPGGYLVIGVPNNDSIFFRKRGAIALNMPPHHMGRWNDRSMEFLSTLYPLNLVEKSYEPIQDYHYEWFKNLLKKKWFFRFLQPLVRNKKIFNAVCKQMKRFYKGHTMVFVFRKAETDLL